MAISSFVPRVPLMRGLTQEGHGVRNLLGVTASHEGQIVTYQGCPSMDILYGMPEETWRFLRLPMRHSNICRGGATCVKCDKCKNLGVLPPFPTWEGVLATKIGDPGITDG